MTTYRARLVFMAILCATSPLAPAQDSKPAPKEAPAVETCKGCDDKRSLACPTCIGKGKAIRTCIACAGSGNGACKVCPAFLAAFQKALPDLKLPKGRIPCLNSYCDRKGRMKWFDGKLQACNACAAKGSFDCPQCRDGITKCGVCFGRSKTEGPCIDCGGVGALACFTCRPPRDKAACVLCANSKKHTCKTCDGKGSGSGKKCRACFAEGTTPCTKCLGSKRTPCADCGASGQVRYLIEGSNEKAGVKRCTDCAGRGNFSCEDCKAQGRVACTHCKKGTIEGKCPDCAGGSLPCGGCVLGKWRSHETMGRAYAHAGKHDLAIPHFSLALVAAEKQIDALIAAASARDGDAMEGVATWLKATRKPTLDLLRDRLEAAKAGKPQPASKNGY